MCIDFIRNKAGGVILIPKIIHYVWLGQSKKPDKVLECISSWKKFFPDFKIVEWNESNYNTNISKYVSEAIRLKKWAFASDYIRFDVLKKYGGIYFDTDVEVLATFPDYLLKEDAFTGVESNNLVNPGLVFGAVPNQKFVRKVVNNLSKSSLITANGTLETINQKVTRMLVQDGYQINGRLQVIDDVVVYPSDVFCGFDLDVFEKKVTNNTLSIHHYDASWLGGKDKFKHQLQTIIKRLVGVANYRRLLHGVRRLRKNIETLRE